MNLRTTHGQSEGEGKSGSSLLSTIETAESIHKPGAAAVFPKKMVPEHERQLTLTVS